MSGEGDTTPHLPRVMRLRDVVLFNISAIVGLGWLTTAVIFAASIGLVITWFA